VAGIDDSYIDLAAQKVGGDPELIRRAIAKERGMPYVPADVGIAPAVEPGAPGMPLDVVRTIDPPSPAAMEARAATDDALAALTAAQTIPSKPVPTMPPPVADELTGAPDSMMTPSTAESAPGAGVVRTLEPDATSSSSHVLRTIEPAGPAATGVVRAVEPAVTSTSAEPRVLRTIEPPAAKSADVTVEPGKAMAAVNPPAASTPGTLADQLTLAPSVDSAASDARALAQARQAANDHIASAEEGAAKRRASLADEFRKEYEAERGKYESDAQAGQALSDKTFAEYQKINDDIKRLPPVHDSRNRGQRIGSILAVLIGGESAQRVVDANVERDLKTQQQNLDNKRADSAGKFNELSIARQLTQDKREQYKFASLLRKERYLTEVDAMMAGLDASTARDKAALKNAADLEATRKEMNDLLQTEIGAKGMAFQAIALGKMTPAEAAAFIGGGAGGPDAALKTDAKNATARSTINKSQEQLAQGYHPAGSKLAPGLFVADEEIWNRKKPEEKQKEQNVDFQSRELVRQMKAVRDYIAANPDYATDLGKRAAIDAKRTHILTTFKDAKELGALDNGVERVVNRAVGDPTGWQDSVIAAVGGTPQALATLDASIDDANSAIASRRSNNGLGNTAPAAASEPATPAPAQRAARKPAAAPATNTATIKRRNADADLQ
jgi:hypothetical protein